ncbi:MAG: diacylglycerol kinase family lipid kinase [Candidatus Aminicenantes bacterium]|nr:diacylglycerol kinase family lipid kinase [Candidatus Aminicenantes bacterium]
MINAKKTHVIINPQSASGKTAKRQNQILDMIDRKLGKGYSLFIIRNPHDASFSIRNAISKGKTLIIVAGGDGTIQDAVNGFFSNGKLSNPECQLGIINSGTGCGFAQTLHLPTSFEAQIQTIINGESRAVDIGKIIYKNGDGTTKKRYFVNECQSGIGGAVVKRLSATFKRIGGFIAFGSTSVLTALRYQGRPATVIIDGTIKVSRPLLGIVVSIGRYTGGGMDLMPLAVVDDSLLDILLIHDQPVSKRFSNFAKIYSGRHISSPEFSYYKGKKVFVSSPTSIPLEADGEYLGGLPFSVEIIPSCLQIKCSGQNNGGLT